MNIITQNYELVNGGVEETRTPHLSNANAALYQMSYYPTEIILAQKAYGE